MVAGGLKGLGGGRGAAPGPGSVIAVLDLGSSKCSCLIAEVLVAPGTIQVPLNRSIRILGYGTTASRGIANGAIANLEEAERSIRAAVDIAERNARLRIHEVHVNVSGGFPQSLAAHAHVKVETGVVSPRDIESGVVAALGKADVGKRHVLHVMPSAYALDDVPAAEAPLGMHGEVLGVEVAVVTVEAPSMRNLQRVLAQAHLNPISFALSPLAAGRGVLTSDEMSLGSVLVDMGAHMTALAAFRDGRFVACEMVPVGAMHVTNDIAQGLGTTLAHAERLKTMFGNVISYATDEREMLAVPLLGERGLDAVHHIPRSQLTAIIRPRMEELIEMIRHRLETTEAFAGTSRLIFTGGGSQLQGLRELATSVFGHAVRIGQPPALQGISEASLTAGLAVPVGLLAMALTPERQLTLQGTAKDALERANMGYVKRVGRWLKEAL